MRGRDILSLALGALWQSKVRTLLTLAGVALGGAMLVISLSLGQGLRTFVADAFHKDDRLRKTFVSAAPRPVAFDESAIPPGEIDVPEGVGDARRDRLREYLIDRYRLKLPHERVKLTTDRLDAIAALPHVAGVAPEVYEQAAVTIDGNARTAALRLLPPDSRKLQDRLVVGRLPGPGAAEVLVSEWLLFDAGVVADAAVERFVGTRLRLAVRDSSRGSPFTMLQLLGATAAWSGLSADELRALGDLADKLPAALDRLDLTPDQRRLVRRLLDRPRPHRAAPAEAAGEFTVVGVYYRNPDDDRGWWGGNLTDGDLIVPAGPGRDLLARLPNYAADGFGQAVVTVDEEAAVPAVEAELHRLGYRTNSLAEWAGRAMQEVTLIGAGMTVLSVMALIVAGLGITNTMVTTVLERTHDIGIMKAVGARDRQVLGLFLIEGAVLGLAGGGLGLLGAWLFSLPAEGWIRAVMERQAQQKIVDPIFRFPAWLLAVGPLFAVLVTTAAALLPARRAARIDPAVTLRAE